jgi:glycosyltransferase involved in cell wall biosynthesis
VNYGIPLDKYKPCYGKDDYILFLSRFHPAKGIYEAIELARKYGFKLIMAGSTEFPDHAYHYVKALEMVRGMENVKIIKDPSFEEKVELLGRAKALLYPLNYAEAFGLLIVEALACATPVLTYKRWVTPELHDGVLELNEENLERVLRGDMKYEDCRRFAEKFSVERMITEYEDLARRVMNGETWG